MQDLLIPSPQAPKMTTVCMRFHAMHDQLVRLGRLSRSQSAQNYADLVNYLRSNPATPDGAHFSEFINLGA